jgi:hypothetical protein
MSAAELKELEGNLSTLFQHLDGKTEVSAESDSETGSLELQKTIAEIIKLQAEADLARAETEKTNAETQKILTEISKAKVERVSIAMDALNKFGTAILKVGAVVSCGRISNHWRDSRHGLENGDHRQADQRDPRGQNDEGRKHQEAC